MEINEIEQKLKTMKNPQPQNSEFKTNLKKRLDNLYSLNSKAMNANKEESQAEAKQSRSLNNQSKKRGLPLVGKFSLAGTLFTLLFMCTLGTTLAYFGVPTVRETVDEILGQEPEKKGVLSVETAPVEAEIFLNGESFGKAPQDFELPPGNYSLRLVSAGYEDYFESFSLADKEEKLITVEMEALDPYLGWFTYNNEEYGFGFRYLRDWKIGENSNKPNEFVVSLTGNMFGTTISYSEPAGFGGDLRNNYETIVLSNGNEINIGTNSEGRISDADMMLFNDEENIEEMLFTRISVNLENGFENDEIKEMILKFAETIWFEGKGIEEEEYEAPSTDVSGRFVWQVDEEVYSVDTTGEDMQTFTFSQNRLINTLISPDGKWLVFNGSNGGVEIMDTLGNNSQTLIDPISTIDDVYFHYEIGGGGWNADSQKFIYGLRIMKGDRYYEGDPKLLDVYNNVSAGYYIFDISTGQSSYLEDSSDLFIAKWSSEGDYIYSSLGHPTADGKYWLREYDLTNGGVYKDYSFSGAVKYGSYQIDVYGRDKIVLRGGVPESSSIYLAHIEGNEIKIDQNLSQIGWAEAQWPRFSENGRYIVFNWNKFYDTDRERWLFINSDKYQADYVKLNTNETIFVVDYVDKLNYPVAPSIYLIDLTSRTEVKKVWSSDETDHYLTVPGDHLN